MNKKNRKKMLKKNLLLALIVLLLAVIPLLINKNAEFGGADDKAKAAINQIDKNYKPWFTPIWTPPSGEIASLLFSLQAAIGAGFIGYYLGYAKGKKAINKSEKI